MSETEFDKELLDFFSKVIDDDFESELLEMILKSKTNNEVIEWLITSKRGSKNDQA